MSEIMIIGSSQVLTASGADGTENHLRYGAENDRVTLIRRTWADITDMFDDAARHRLRYAIKHFIVAPYEPTTRHLMLTVALPLLAAEFNFNAFECSVVEHEKDRADDEAFNLHWHVVCPHFTADGHVNDWWQDYQRQEKVARILEYKLWLLNPDRDPAGPLFVLGRFHAANIAAFRADPDPEMQALADALERAFPIDAQPEGTAPPAAVVRMHKREGRDIVQLRKVCREAWRKSTTDEEFRRLIEAEGLYVTLAEEPPPRWMITDGETVLVGTLAGMTHAKRAEVLKRMGDPAYDDWYAGERGRGLGGTDAIDAGEGRDAAEMAEIVVDRVPVVAVQPVGHRHGKTSSQLFIDALRRAEPSRLKRLLDRATELAQSAFARAIAYLATAEKGAREYLTWTAQDMPAPSEELSELRTKLNKLAKKMADATAAIERASGKERDRLLDVRGYTKVEIEELDKLTAPLEFSYAAEKELYRATIVKEKLERANRYIRVVPRIRALIDHAPQVLWAGVETIFARAVVEDKKAKPAARFRAEPSSSSVKDDADYKPPGSKL